MDQIKLRKNHYLISIRFVKNLPTDQIESLNRSFKEYDNKDLLLALTGGAPWRKKIE